MQLHAYNNQRRAKLHAEAEQDIDTIDEWKEPKGTWRLSISTMERNIRRDNAKGNCGKDYN